MTDAPFDASLPQRDADPAIPLAALADSAIPETAHLQPKKKRHWQCHTAYGSSKIVRAHSGTLPSRLSPQPREQVCTWAMGRVSHCVLASAFVWALAKWALASASSLFKLPIWAWASCNRPISTRASASDNLPSFRFFREPILCRPDGPERDFFPFFGTGSARAGVAASATFDGLTGRAAFPPLAGFAGRAALPGIAADRGTEANPVEIRPLGPNQRRK